MAISLYDISVAAFVQTLGGVAGFLEKGRAHCEDNGLNPDELVEARLCPDMLDFRFQIASVVHHSLGAIEAAKAGLFTPSAGPAGLDYRGLQRHVGEAREALQALGAEEINALEGRDMVFQLGERRLPFTVEGFLISFSLPNLHFHATTAYDILRGRGAPLGKRDYLGQLRLKA